jgi:hypothetical protein
MLPQMWSGLCEKAMTILTNELLISKRDFQKSHKRTEISYPLQGYRQRERDGHGKQRKEEKLYWLENDDHASVCP